LKNVIFSKAIRLLDTNTPRPYKEQKAKREWIVK